MWESLSGMKVLVLLRPWLAASRCHVERMEGPADRFPWQRGPSDGPLCSEQPGGRQGIRCVADPGKRTLHADLLSGGLRDLRGTHEGRRWALSCARALGHTFGSV